MPAISLTREPVPAIPDLLRHATLLESSPDAFGRPAYKAFHTFAAAAELAGKRFDVILHVRETRDGTFHYSLGTDKLELPGSRSVSGRPQGGALDQGVAPPASESAPGELNIRLATVADKAAPRGRITFSEHGALIELFANADRSTFLHETGHLWLRQLMRYAQRAATSQCRSTAAAC